MRFLIPFIALASIGCAAKQKSIDAAVAAAVAQKQAVAPVVAPAVAPAPVNTDPRAWISDTYAGRDRSKDVCAKAGPFAVSGVGDAGNYVTDAMDAATINLGKAIQVKTENAVQRGVKIVKGIAGQPQNITNVDNISRTFIKETMRGVQDAGTILVRKDSKGEWVKDEFEPQSVYARACITIDSNQAVQKIAQAMGITNAVIQQANEIRDDQVMLFDKMKESFMADSPSE